MSSLVWSKINHGINNDPALKVSSQEPLKTKENQGILESNKFVHDIKDDPVFQVSS